MSIIERFRLDNQVAIVTGGGRGIGRAITLAYAEAGADVVCAARTLADVEAVAAEIRAMGRRALAVTCDVTDMAQLAAVVDAAMKEFGRITHLVNNAGGSGPNDPLKMPTDKFEEVFRFNVSSAYELTRLCVPHMRAAGGGRRQHREHQLGRGALRPALFQRLRHGEGRAEPSHPPART